MPYSPAASICSSFSICLFTCVLEIDRGRGGTVYPWAILMSAVGIERCGSSVDIPGGYCEVSEGILWIVSPYHWGGLMSSQLWGQRVGWRGKWGSWADAVKEHIRLTGFLQAFLSLIPLHLKICYSLHQCPHTSYVTTKLVLHLFGMPPCCPSVSLSALSAFSSEYPCPPPWRFSFCWAAPSGHCLSRVY